MVSDSQGNGTDKTSCWYKESNNRLVVADQVFEILTVLLLLMGCCFFLGGFGVWGFVLVFLGGVFAFVLWVVCFFWLVWVLFWVFWGEAG